MRQSLFRISRPIFAHSTASPPALSLSTKIHLELINSTGRISLVEQRSGSETQFLLTVNDSQDIGLTSSDQSAIERAFRDLLLAANLTFKRAALSAFQIVFKEPRLEFEEQPDKVKVEKAPDGSVHVNIHEVMHIVETWHAEIRFSEALDEEQVFRNLALIIKLNRHQLSPTDSIRKVNLASSLISFEDAMSSPEKATIFKNLFIALELATNFDGTSRRGLEFDQEAACITTVSSESVERWRQLYNRMKHADVSGTDVRKHIEGVKELSTFIAELREACAKAILVRLGSKA